MSLHELEIRDLVVGVRLGCEAEERRVPQEVAFTVAFRFHLQPEACHSDELADTVCYADVSQLIEDVIRDREFHLIEYLAAEIFTRLSARFESRALLRLQVHKLRPPVDGLRGGSIYRISQFASETANESLK